MSFLLRRRHPRAAWWLLLSLLFAVSPMAARDPTIRVGNHPGFARLVFSLPPGAAFTATRTADRLILALPGGGAFASIAHGTHNVLSLLGGTDQASMILAPGATPLIWRQGASLVVDIHDLPGPPPGALGTPPRLAAPPVSIAVATPALPKPVALPAAIPARHEPSGENLAAVRLAAEPGASSSTILVPFGPGVGAAAFARGTDGVVVFDTARNLDLAALANDPVFGAAVTRRLPAATVMQLRLEGQQIHLVRRPDGWVIAVGPALSPAPAIALHTQAGVLTLAAGQPGGVVVIDDKATGGRLLVGTQQDNGGRVGIVRQSPEFVLLPTWQGVVVDPVSDRVELRVGRAGFQIAGLLGAAMAMAPGSDGERGMSRAGNLTRRFDFADLPVPTLLLALRAELHSAALLPRLRRFEPRLRAAEYMLALGLNQEAAAVLRVAMADDPTQDAAGAPVPAPEAAALLAIAEFLAGRPADASALDAPALGHSDEISLWRAALLPEAADPAPAAAVFASSGGLILAYPQPLRRALLPIAAERLAKAKQMVALAALLAASGDASLDPARASLLRNQGRTDDALALLDRMAAGRDRKQAAYARREAVELRLSAHRIDAAAAAAALARQLYAWRNDATDLELRLRLAELREQAGAWRPALGLLRETETLFPDAKTRIRDAEAALVAGLVQGDAARRVPPLELIALIEESAELLSQTDAGQTLAPVLVDKFLALDLPERAEPILHRLIAQATLPAPRAELGLRLARLRLDQQDWRQAKSVLEATAAPGLPADLVARRAFVGARALAGSGDAPGALAALDGMADSEALGLRATLQEQRHDWHGAETTLAVLMQSAVPTSGALTDAQQDLVVRLASAASQAGDMAALQRLQAMAGGRITVGPRADLLHLLLAGPIVAVEDLKRSGGEVVAARALPASLASLGRSFVRR